MDTRKIIYSCTPRGSSKESFVGNETAHNQSLLVASTDIISPPRQHNCMEMIYFLTQFLLNSPCLVTI